MSAAAMMMVRRELLDRDIESGVVQAVVSQRALSENIRFSLYVPLMAVLLLFTDSNIC
jgi:hypothetical protein